MVSSAGKSQSDVDKGQSEFINVAGKYHVVFLDGSYSPTDEEKFQPASVRLKFEVVHSVDGLSPTGSITYVKNNLGTKRYENRQLVGLDEPSDNQINLILKMFDRLGLAEENENGELVVHSACSVGAGTTDFNEQELWKDAQGRHYVILIEEDEYEKRDSEGHPKKDEHGNIERGYSYRCPFNQFWPADHPDVADVECDEEALATAGIFRGESTEGNEEERGTAISEIDI